MDYSAIPTEALTVLAVLLLGIMVGKGAGMESRVLNGYLIIAVLLPTVFAPVALGYLVVCIIVKVGAQWVTWL